MWKVTSCKASTSGSKTFVTESNTIIEPELGLVATGGSASAVADWLVWVSVSGTFQMTALPTWCAWCGGVAGL